MAHLAGLRGSKICFLWGWYGGTPAAFAAFADSPLPAPSLHVLPGSVTSLPFANTMCLALPMSRPLSFSSKRKEQLAGSGTTGSLMRPYIAQVMLLMRALGISHTRDTPVGDALLRCDW
jgi:hypothetical protein